MLPWWSLYRVRGQGSLLAVTNNNIRPTIIIQNRRNEHTFDTYACTIDLVPLVLEKTCFAGLIFEYKWKTKQKAQSKKRKVEMREENKWKRPPTHQSWAEHHRGRALGPATSPPGKGGGQASQPGCSRTIGVPAPQAVWPMPSHQPTWQRRWSGEPVRLQPHPRCARALGSGTQAQPLQAVAWQHAWSVHGGFLIFLRQTDHVAV